jgi:pimeloyl-ACP methyl ester carboxylesterase
VLSDAADTAEEELIAVCTLISLAPSAGPYPRLVEVLPDNVVDSASNLDDWRGVGYLVALATERLTAPVEGMHREIVGRWLGIAGPTAEPAGRAVDGLIASIYHTIRLGGTVAGSVISIGAELTEGRASLRPVWETPKGKYVQSIINGVWGDRFDEDQSPFRIELGLRDPDGRLVPATPTSLRHAFPRPSGRLAVMAHGLGENERSWESADGAGLANGLQADGFSVLRLRYNTGRRVTENGLDLANLLEEVHRAWPVPVEEITLIGHSMGGLVVESAVDAGRSSGQGWVERATHVVALSAPHLGSPIEKLVHLFSRSLGLFRESRPIGTFLDQRSAGIRDLRHGPDLDGASRGSIEHHLVGGTVTSDPTHPLGALVGDLVVRVASATRKGGDVETEVLVVGGSTHAGLRHNTEVVARIRTWLDTGQQGRLGEQPSA